MSGLTATPDYRAFLTDVKDRVRRAATRRALAPRRDSETARFTFALGPQHPADAVHTVEPLEAELMEDKT